MQAAPTPEARAASPDMRPTSPEPSSPVPIVTVDSSTDFLYRPHTLTALAALIGIFIYTAFVTTETHDPVANTKKGFLAATLFLILFGVLSFRDGPFIRPHPALWRTVMAAGVAYQIFLVIILFQDADSARTIFKLYDPSLGRPLPERSYAGNCELSWSNVMDQLDEFVIAHILGWYAKAIVIRDYWFCWVLSILFELCEYSLQHHLPNFAECWWDHWIVDVLICNWLGTYLGMKTCEFFEMRQYSWRGMGEIRSYRGKMKRAVQQFTPRSWTKFSWGTTKSFRNYVAVIVLLVIILLAELNAFYLKFILWIPASHPLNVYRLLLIFFFAIPAVRELYQYITDRTVTRLGAQAWLTVAIVFTEVLICIKFGRHMFPEPFPAHVVRFWSVFAAGIVAYPIWQFGIPYLQSSRQHAKLE
ncbi:hypothetical protein RI367_000755 [Sorochytrium milnesiophthora]